VKQFNGRVAAITGAGSGIGRALAVGLAGRGAHLSLSDIDQQGLAETVGLCEGRGVKVTSNVLDVSDRAAVYAWADQVADEHGTVNLVINNAGVALGATVEGMSYEDFDWLMNINFWGVVSGTKAFLPHLKASGEGHIVNISSVFGLISVPSQSAYNAAKFAVRGFSDTLRMELEIERSCVSATPTRAAEQILAAVCRDRRRATVGADGAVINFISRLPAGLYQRALVLGARRRR